MSVTDIAVLNNLLFQVFVAGAVLGLIVSGLLKNILNLWAYRFERPKRIKTQDDFLYFFNGKYYSIEQRNKLIEERRKKFKDIPYWQNTTDKIFFIITFFIGVVFVYYLYLLDLFS
jgi:hypothetical protein